MPLKTTPTQPVTVGKHCVGYGAKQLGHVQQTFELRSQGAAASPFSGQPIDPCEGMTSASIASEASPLPSASRIDDPPSEPGGMVPPLEPPPDPPPSPNDVVASPVSDNTPPSWPTPETPPRPKPQPSPATTTVAASAPRRTALRKRRRLTPFIAHQTLEDANGRPPVNAQPQPACFWAAGRYRSSGYSGSHRSREPRSRALVYPALSGERVRVST